MAREIRNLGASIRARLLDRARSERADFQILLTRYALERLLYRLSISPEREHFILKGAMLFAVWLEDPFRPTRDLDLLGSGNPDAAAVAERFRIILAADAADDGVIFDISGLQAAPIRDVAEYGGVRVRTTTSVGGAQVPIQVDIGFGDAVTPEPIEIAYPTLLDAPSPRLRAYPPETVVAEKVEALVSLGMANSRMKDFYDLWAIAQTFSFERSVLEAALRRTFERRRTPWPADIPPGLSDGFAADKQAQWRAFLNRDRLGAAPERFERTVADLRAFLVPLLIERSDPALWRPGGPWTAEASHRGASHE